MKSIDYTALLLLLLLSSIAMINPAAAAWTPPTDTAIYGVEWNASDPSPVLEWIDADGNPISAPNFSSHVIWGNIKRVLLDDENVVTRVTNPRGDGLDLSGASGKVMTEIPKFYVKSENASTDTFRYYRWWISPDPADGFELHPAFVQRGGVERDNIYVGSYEATLRVLDDGTLALDSRSGEQPWTGCYNNPLDGMFKLAFDGGTTAPAIGATVTGTTSGTAGQVVDYYVASGSWATNDAAGFLILKQTSGTFTNDEPLTVSGSPFAAADTPNGNAGIVATINTFETAGEALGDGYGAMNVWTYSAIRMLHLVEYANWGSQETVGLGIVSKGSGTGFAGEITGYNSVDTNVNEFGTGSGTGSAGYTPASYRTMTDLWGNSWEWVTGYTSTNTEYQIVKRDGTGSLSTHPLAAGSYESSEATPLGADGYVYGYWTSLFHEDLLQYQFLANSVTGGSYSTYGTDYQYSHNPGTRVLLAGGSWPDGRPAGLGALFAYGAASYSARNSGARLEFTGPATLHGAAPAAQYALNASAGNAPLAIAFTDTSTGSPGWWRWDFGDGTSSTEQNPVHTYTEPGTYNVTLTAYTLYGENTTTQTVEVRAPPVATFTQNATEGNAPLAVQFTDTSTGNVTAWSWSFGDGETSSQQSPTHTYASPGTYIVTLNASNPYGFSLNTTVISVLDPPVAAFTANTTVIPTGSAVAFTDTSTGNVTAWSWSFGDGETSSQQSPVHTYSTAGTYTVTLNASNPYGFSISTQTDYIDVGHPPAADFTTNATGGNAPLTVQFTDTTENTPTAWLWTFGDGETSTLQSPSHTYAEPGTYTVTLTATNAYGEDTETKTDHITVLTAPGASFTVNATEGNAPLTVAFTDTSTGDITGWAWTFGDGETSTAQSPSHTYAAPGTYTVTLNASNPYGYSLSTRTALVTALAPPAAGFTQNMTGGNAPLTVQFTDTSTGNVTAWSWLFGDGQTSTLQNPAHTYAAAGTYTVTLNASNAYGYDISTQTDLITVLTLPAAAFTANVTGGNAPLTVQFTDTSTGDIDDRHWDFGDGQTSTQPNPIHTYLEPGIYTVTLTVSNAYSSDTSPATEVTVLSPPAASFTQNVTGGNAPLTVRFTDTSTGDIDDWLWAFGDGQTSTDQSPAHTYLEPGIYTVTLNASNSYGYNIASTDITVLEPPGANFTANVTLGLTPLAVQFTDTSTGNVTAWDWDFGDGNSSIEQNPIHTYESPGTYTVILNASNSYGYSIVTKPDLIAVYAPITPDFTIDPAYGLIPLPVQFNDTSTGNPTSWAWDFGDGNSSIEQNPLHTYTGIGTYTVTLTVSHPADEQTVTRTDAVTADYMYTPAFTQNVSFGLVPFAVQFTDTTNISVGAPSGYLWDFGDGNNSTAQNPIHIYTRPGYYNVSLTVYGTSTQNTLTKFSAVHAGILPTAAFTANLTSGYAPLTVQFTSNCQNTNTYHWDFGDGSWSTVQNPTHTYNTHGTYTVTLTATNVYGSATANRTITVTEVPPIAGFTASPLTGEAPTLIKFTDTSTNSPTSWFWDFGDGNISTARHPTHLYYNPGTYTVSLTVSNTGGSDTLIRTNYITLTEPSPSTATPRFPETDQVETLGVTDLGTSTVTLHGTLVSGSPQKVWFEYGTKSNSYGFTVARQQVNPGESFSATISSFPLVAGQTYYYRAACEAGYGKERSFTLPSTPPHATTTYGAAAYQFINSYQNETTMVDDIATATWSPYTSVLGSLFFAMVIGAVFLNLAMKGRSLALPAMLVLVIGLSLWTLLPPEAAMIAQAFIILAIGGIIYWISTKRKI